MDATQSAAEMDLLRRCARWAITEGGLRLKPFGLKWLDPRFEMWDTVHGHVSRESPPTMFLKLGLPPRTLAEVVFHECMHVHDVLANSPFPTAELEARAARFASRMMQTWRG